MLTPEGYTMRQFLVNFQFHPNVSPNLKVHTMHRVPLHCPDVTPEGYTMRQFPITPERISEPKSGCKFHFAADEHTKKTRRTPDDSRWIHDALTNVPMHTRCTHEVNTITYLRVSIG